MTLLSPPGAEDSSSSTPPARPPVQRPKVQRPTGTKPAEPAPAVPSPESPAEPAPATPPATPPAAPPAAPAAPAEAPLETPLATVEPLSGDQAQGDSSLQIRVLDSVQEMPVEGALVLIHGRGLEERIELITDVGGYADTSLPPGTYSVRVLAGKVDETRVVTLEPGATPVDFEVDRGRWSRDVEGTKRPDARPELRRAQLVASAGGVLIAGGIMMGITAALEAQKPDCPLDQTDCNFAPRPKIAGGLGIGAAVSIASGTALVVLGVRGIRRARPAVYVTPHTAGVSMSMRF